MNKQQCQRHNERHGMKDAHTKQLYEEPEMSVIVFGTNDVITTSGDSSDDDVHLPEVDF